MTSTLNINSLRSRSAQSARTRVRPDIWNLVARAIRKNPSQESIHATVAVVTV